MRTEPIDSVVDANPNAMAGEIDPFYLFLSVLLFLHLTSAASRLSRFINGR